MEKLSFDLSKPLAPFKILNATNGGPWCKRHFNDQTRSNFEEYKAARIPYARNHDANACGTYGGPFAHDISAIFPDFEKDITDPASYDFACTDEAIHIWLEAGTKTFFRLGQTIEHQIKKHDTLPPKDFHKWAFVCEHIIRHYTEGWADGYELDMEYWEIWNEPDLDADDSDNKRTWGGVKAEFFDLYEITAKHLKKCFPHLKIGGPALAWDEDWAKEFLCEMQKRNVPIDFFSWHIYCTEPVYMMEKADRIKAFLNKYGYGDSESILNEWNYVKGWTDEFVDSIKTIQSAKGAAFVMACISEAQHSTIDMLMYYSTIPHIWCNAFDYYTYEVRKGYYPLYWYGMFYDMKGEILSEEKIENIYSLCGVDEEGKTLTVITYYTDKENEPSKNIFLDFGREGEYEIYLLDEDTDGIYTETKKELRFTMKPNSCIMIKEV